MFVLYQKESAERTRKLKVGSKSKSEGEVEQRCLSTCASLTDALADVDTVWLNRQQLAALFGRDIKTIGKHIANALKEELKGFPVVAKIATTAADGKTYQVEHYSLDMILSVGYRVKSSEGIRFRIWANGVLKSILMHRAHDARFLKELERRLADHEGRIAAAEKVIKYVVNTLHATSDESATDRI